MSTTLFYTITAISILLIVVAWAIIFSIIRLCCRLIDRSDKTQEDLYKWIKYAIEHDKTN